MISGGFDWSNRELTVNRNILTVLAMLLVSGCSGFNKQSLRPENPSLSMQLGLPIPTSGSVKVAPGDTVYSIARRYGVGMRDVISENGLEPPFILQIGQSLRLPPPRRYTVVPGDTFYAILWRFNLDMRTLARMNSLSPPYQLTAGQVLRMPARQVSAMPKQFKISPQKSSSSAVPTPEPRPTLTGESRFDKPRDIGSSLSGRTKGAEPPRPPKRAGNRFLWPVRGRIISNFGPRAGGLHNDGINIAAPKGSAILAADNGVVAYAGKGLKGFGNLLLIKHADGWTTAYAHVDRILIRRGEVVERGQTIATIGSSGGVLRPQLHFEIRKGARAVDPRGQLDI
ncbi:MAG: peptidase M23 [Rhodospirillaceae bacterium]|mgnify:CR=1 FL=1|nr:peptidase M23 [Rhodospirillaceae bacterium]